MIEQPFKISDHLHLKVRYTLDTPYRNENRAQLAEYILAVACGDQNTFHPQPNGMRCLRRS